MCMQQSGATSGIGSETARVLALRGVHVIMAVRNTEKATQVKETILEDIPNAKVDIMELDLSSMASVRDFAAKYQSSGLPLHVLINNAGVLSPQFKLSNEKIELHFATNHLGHFLLTNLLLETMKTTSYEQNTEGRIINVSSEGHRFAYTGPLSDYMNNESSYSSIYAYGLSKLANILHANELARLLKGAATTCYLALNPQVKGVTGEFFVDSNLAKPSSRAKDQELAKELWEFSMGLTSSK
ncbi:putative very-long-chain 3-oxoacyl-CoA reductase [Helianthus annuus]|nr:putative very-long-chain 3-oxoacyl-CoA reductase [Helianthus annuus]